jgi:cathepsin D
MLFDALTLSFALHLLLGDFAQALPSSPTRLPSSSSRSLHIPLLRRAVSQRNDTEVGLWAKQQKQFLENKYGGSSTTKRSSGTNLCV